MLEIFNRTTKQRIEVDFYLPIPRSGETISFGEEILKVLEVHYGIDLEGKSYFVDILVENKHGE